jgi:hypothetical protein
VRRQRLALSDEQLQAYEVQACYEFGNWMLDLEPGVDLKKEEPSISAHDELDGSRTHIADCSGGSDGRRAKLSAECVVDGGRGRLLDDLLVAALDRALALEEVDRVAVAVGEDLDLDVARRLEVVLEEDRAVAESRRCFTTRGRNRVKQL